MHPIYKYDKTDIKKLKKYSQKKRVIAIGETGLDFYRSRNSINQQINLFKKHIYIAKKLKKPIIVHNRYSKKKTIEILKKEKAYECSGILHSFNEDLETAKKLLDINFYISFSGMITFKKSHSLQKLIKFIPLNKILLETDSPYLTPEPYRGRPNKPAFLYEIAKFISHLLKKDFFELVDQLRENFFTLFNLNKKILNIKNIK